MREDFPGKQGLREWATEATGRKSSMYNEWQRDSQGRRAWEAPVAQRGGYLQGIVGSRLGESWGFSMLRCLAFYAVGMERRLANFPIHKGFNSRCPVGA